MNIYACMRSSYLQSSLDCLSRAANNPVHSIRKNHRDEEHLNGGKSKRRKHLHISIYLCYIYMYVHNICTYALRLNGGETAGRSTCIFPYTCVIYTCMYTINMHICTYEQHLNGGKSKGGSTCAFP